MLNTVFMLSKQLKTSVSCRSACSANAVNPLMAQEASLTTELPRSKKTKTNANHQVCILLIVRASTPSPPPCLHTR